MSNTTHQDLRPATARRSIGRNALGVAYQWVISECNPGTTVLDFGCGYGQAQEPLLLAGFNWYGYDLQPRAGYKLADIVNYRYDIVVLSNVVNVQPTLIYLHNTIQAAAQAVADGGILVWNHPAKPRKMDYMNLQDMVEFAEQLLHTQGFVTTHLLRGPSICVMQKRGKKG
jgi:SAM-dependent methyltransferase